MAKENLSHHRDTEETNGTPVAAGSGKPGKESTAKTGWLPYVIVAAAIAAYGLILWILN